MIRSKVVNVDDLYIKQSDPYLENYMKLDPNTCACANRPKHSKVKEDIKVFKAGLCKKCYFSNNDGNYVHSKAVKYGMRNCRWHSCRYPSITGSDFCKVHKVNGERSYKLRKKK